MQNNPCVKIKPNGAECTHTDEVRSTQLAVSNQNLHGLSLKGITMSNQSIGGFVIVCEDRFAVRGGDQIVLGLSPYTTDIREARIYLTKERAERDIVVPDVEKVVPLYELLDVDKFDVPSKE